MAWSRGFFRIWIAMSIIYVVVAGAIAATYHTAMKPLFVAPKFEIALTGDTKGVIDTSKDREANETVMRFALIKDIDVLRRAGRTVEAADEESKFQPKVQGTVDELYAIGGKMRSDAVSTFTVAALAMFLPPIVLLGVGWCIGWIAQGFRRA